MTPILSPQPAKAELRLDAITPAGPCSESRKQLRDSVGEVPQGMSDEERERHIASCGVLMLQAYSRYEETSCLTDRAEADRWRLLQIEAIKGRSVAQICRMEEARGFT